MARQQVDFTTSPNTPPNNPSPDALDTGETGSAAIRPLTNGEPANQAVLARADENLRVRTERIRQELEDLKYLSDADRQLILTSSGNVTWTGLPTGTFSTTAPLTLRPFMAPDASTMSRLVICQGTEAQITLRTKVTGAPGQRRAYDGANSISFDFQPVTTANGLVVITVNGTPSDNFHVQYDDDAAFGTTVSQMLTAINSNAQVIAAGLEAVTVGSGTPIEVVYPPVPVVNGGARIRNNITLGERATRFMSGAADAEKHIISDAQLSSFFMADGTLNRLIEGDVLCIQYDALVMGSNGGRRQSLPEAPESKSLAAGANLFMLRRFPERLPGALPLATVVNGQLIFVSGRVYTTGESGPLVSAGASYQGSGPWRDTVVIAAGSFESAVDTIVSSLASSLAVSGAGKVGYFAGGDIVANSVQGALTELDTKKAALALPNTFVKGNVILPNTAATTALTATGTTTGAGISGTGGVSGIGVIGNGGVTGGPGVFGLGAANLPPAHGVLGNAAAPTVAATALANGPYGVVGVGGDAGGYGHGVVGVGAAELNGDGLVGLGSGATPAFAGNGIGVQGVGASGSSSAGVVGTGGSSGGVGVQGVGRTGAVTGYGVQGTGGGTAGTPGVRGDGGSAGGPGVEGQGTGTGHGLQGVSSSNAASNGVRAVASADGGYALVATHDGVVANSHGLRGIGRGIGVGLSATSGTGLDAIGGSFFGGGTGLSHGLLAQPGGNGNGVRAWGSVGGGAAVHGSALAAGAVGLSGLGSGNGAGVIAEGGATGSAFEATPGAIGAGLLLKTATNSPVRYETPKPGAIYITGGDFKTHNVAGTPDFQGPFINPTALRSGVSFNSSATLTSSFRLPLSAVITGVNVIVNHGGTGSGASASLKIRRYVISLGANAWASVNVLANDPTVLGLAAGATAVDVLSPAISGTAADRTVITDTQLFNATLQVAAGGGGWCYVEMIIITFNYTITTSPNIYG